MSATLIIIHDSYNPHTSSISYSILNISSSKPSYHRINNPNNSSVISYNIRLLHIIMNSIPYFPYLYWRNVSNILIFCINNPKSNSLSIIQFNSNSPITVINIYILIHYKHKTINSVLSTPPSKFYIPSIKRTHINYISTNPFIHYNRSS